MTALLSRKLKPGRASGGVKTAFVIWGMVLFVGAFAIFLGLVSALLPSVLVLGLAATLVLIPTFMLRPQWLLVPTILACMYAPSVRISDVLFALLLVRALVDLLRAGSFSAQRPLAWTMLGVLAITVLLALMYGVALGNSVPFIYRDSRVFLYWGVIAMVIAWAPRDEPGAWFLKQLILLTAVVCALVLIQGLFKIQLVSVAAISGVETLGQASSTELRVQLPGFMFVAMAVMMAVPAFSRFTHPLQRMALLVLLLAMLAALAFNYGRALWLAILFGFFVAAALGGPRKFIGLSLAGLVLLTVVLMAIAYLDPAMLAALLNRITSISGEGGFTSSLGWRLQENAQALRALSASNWIGIGMGGEYRMPFLSSVYFEDHTRYVHNGYLFMALKVGLPGLLLVVLGSVFILAKAVRASHEREPQERLLLHGFIGFLATFVVINLNQPEIMTHYGVMAVALAMSVVILAVDPKQVLLASVKRADSTGHGKRLRHQKAVFQ